jgi:hypothetical protein
VGDSLDDLSRETILDVFRGWLRAAPHFSIRRQQAAARLAPFVEQGQLKPRHRRLRVVVAMPVVVQPDPIEQAEGAEIARPFQHVPLGAVVVRVLHRRPQEAEPWPVRLGTNLGYRFYAHRLSQFYNCDWIIGRAPSAPVRTARELEPASA